MSSDYHEVEKILDTYTLEEILEYNELTEVDILIHLLDEEILILPEPKPVDYD